MLALRLGRSKPRTVKVAPASRFDRAQGADF